MKLTRLKFNTSTKRARVTFLATPGMEIAVDPEVAVAIVRGDARWEYLDGAPALEPDETEDVVDGTTHEDPDAGLPEPAHEEDPDEGGTDQKPGVQPKEGEPPEPQPAEAPEPQPTGKAAQKRRSAKKSS